MWKLLSQRMRHRIASYLLGVDTSRAIYIGPKAHVVQWTGPEIDACTVVGADIAFRFVFKQTGRRQVTEAFTKFADKAPE